MFWCFGPEECEILAPQPGNPLPCKVKSKPLDHSGSPKISLSELALIRKYAIFWKKLSPKIHYQNLKSWWEMPVGGSRQPWKQGNIAESHVRGGPITIAPPSPHRPASGSWTIERLAHQMPETLNCKAGHHPESPFKCLMGDLQSKTPARGAPLCAWLAKQQGRTPSKGAL